MNSEKPPKLQPAPRANKRARLAFEIREIAARLRDNFDRPLIADNGELSEHWPTVPGNFTKGFQHDKFGILTSGGPTSVSGYSDPSDYRSFIEFINQGRNSREDFANSDPVGSDVPPSERVWESPLAGHVYDLEGPDSGELTIPPAPRLESGELAAEMAEVYGLALLRDFPFHIIQDGGANPLLAELKNKLTALKKAEGKASGGEKTKLKKTIADIEKQCAQLAGSPSNAKLVNDAVAKVVWFHAPDRDCRAEKRRLARFDKKGKLTPEVLYRGSTDGAKIGPYISQFLLIGNESRSTTPSTADGYNTRTGMCSEHGEPRKIEDGYILYGSQEISQRYTSHRFGLDHMTTWKEWLSVQNGDRAVGDEFEMTRRFITTPRDLATYVHYDQLYQAYLNACLLMLSFGHPVDPGLPEADTRVRDGFATFGGPHILSLVTEVATRALKHARRQKFNTHLRGRPEAIAGRLTLAANGNGAKLGNGETAVASALNNLPSDLLKLVDKRNDGFNGNAGGVPSSKSASKNYLLPMAFPEGSPMHPSYAAGHASVAGACVTILKAFFDMFKAPYEDVCQSWTQLPFGKLHNKGIFEPSDNGMSLRKIKVSGVTIQGELDKLAANISIGRDMAGVHYYTDYYESLRLGERVAIGILQEQMLTYPEPLSMRLNTFDGENMIIHGFGDGETATVEVGKDGEEISYEDWFTRID